MRSALLLLLLAFAASAQTPSQAAKTQPSLGFSPANMDRTANPCADFYQYTCGAWLAKNPIPSDQSHWGVADELEERNRTILRNILDRAAVNDPKRSPDDQKIGDFYYSCLDEAGIEKLGTQPLKADLDRINALTAKPALPAEIARLHSIGANVLFTFSSGPDLKDSTMNMADIDQGGLGLPDRDYYLKDDAPTTAIRREYVAHVQKMLELLGEPAAKAAADSQAVLRFETALAKASLDRVSRRDPDKTYHKLPLADFTALAPDFDWSAYFKALNTPQFSGLNVDVPDFFKALNATLSQTSLDDLKTYLRWHLIHGEAALLPKAFVDEDFRFYGRTLTGAEQLEPRWKRCVSAVDADLGFALGRKFVDQTFGTEGKARTLSMVQQIEKALADEIHALSWMTPATKEQALIKLRAVLNKIGYPDKPRDYSTVKIVRGEAVGNDERATEFEVRRQLNKIGKPVDRSEWLMTPQTVNAYYYPPENSINFPAGILQPPFFDNKMDPPVNYGAVGAIIGHELTHGFDDEGRKFGPQGNLMDWWTPEDAREFERRANCFVQEYSAMLAVDNVHINGQLTLGENTADNGGMRLAFLALMDSLNSHPAASIDGFTPEQRFFLAFGQSWCTNVRPEAARLRAQTDPHSPPKDRVNGVVQNMPEFEKAFSCRVGQPEVRMPSCRVW
ncbi:MAG TPA: M13 family metallopeptidase [Bryobacteraceae bacterium]|nr:M13 family metallopeptidase [Bryobacteraceae bacterium]